MNIVILKGNVTRDPEVKFTPSGTAVLDMGVAVNKVWYNDQGQRQEKTTFVDCRFWGRTAETVQKHFYKGKPILLEGELAQEKWDDRETGKPRSKTLVVVSHWDFAGDTRGPATGGAAAASTLPPRREERHPTHQGEAPRPAWRPTPKPPPEPAPETDDGDEIPF